MTGAQLAILRIVAEWQPRGDRRRRVVALTAAGERVLREAPLAGPVRLRQVPADPARLRDLTAALDDAIQLFGLEDYAR